MMTLYIHIPFCKHKCFYCSFVVSIGQESKIDLYLECLKKEIQQYKNIKIKSIYWGGGTPTVLNNSQMEMLSQMIREVFILDEQLEWTIEANPDGLNIEKIRVFKSLGINRVSLGVQSLHNKYLKFLGRSHGAQLAKDCFSLLRNEGIENINLDLMYDFPQQTMTELKEDVKILTALNSEHVSLYSLMLEEGSRFYTKKMTLSEGEVQADKYSFIVGFLEENGLFQYEISNFSKKNKESQHNKHYWMGGDYIGIGVGAHSHIKGKRYWNVSRLMKYIKGVKSGVSIVESSEQLTKTQMFIESFLFQLRMNQGVDVVRLEKQFQEVLGKERENRLKNFIEEGFLVKDKSILKTTLKGRLVLDELCAWLI